MTTDSLTTARKLSGELLARADDGDRLRTMPPDLVAELHDAGLFAMARPRSLGGLELDLPSQIEVVEEFSRADGSAGWTFFIGAAGAAFCWLDPEVARAALDHDPLLPISQMIAPLGRAVVRPEGGYTVDGRWPFCSGSLHAGWHVLGVRIDGAHEPNWHLAFIPPSAASIIDTWTDPLGLRGTGSHDLSVRGAIVPADHVVSPMFTPARDDSPLGRLPFITQLAVGHAGFALGVARRALDEFTALARTKRRGAHDATAVAETADAQITLARAEATLRSARTFVLDAFGAAWNTALAGDIPSLYDRGEVLLATVHAQRAAETAVDAVLPFAGAAAIRADDALQRCYRDLHTAGQHIFVSADAWKRCARLHLDIDQPTFHI